MEISFSPNDLKPVIEAVVSEMIERFGNERIAYTEAEASALMGVKRHVLRDCRLRGEVGHSKVGSKIIYSRRQLLDFIEGRGF